MICDNFHHPTDGTGRPAREKQSGGRKRYSRRSSMSSGTREMTSERTAFPSKAAATAADMASRGNEASLTPYQQAVEKPSLWTLKTLKALGLSTRVSKELTSSWRAVDCNRTWAYIPAARST